MRLTTCTLGLALAGLTAFWRFAARTFPTPGSPTIFVPFAAGVLPDDRGISAMAERQQTAIENRPGAGTILATSCACAGRSRWLARCVTTTLRDQSGDQPAADLMTCSAISLASVWRFWCWPLAGEPGAFAPNGHRRTRRLRQAHRRVASTHFASARAGSGISRAHGWKTRLASSSRISPSNGSTGADRRDRRLRCLLCFDSVEFGGGVHGHGRLKPFAVASAQRLQDAPQYPTLAETFPGSDVSAFRPSPCRKACRR